MARRTKLPQLAVGHRELDPLINLIDNGPDVPELPPGIRLSAPARSEWDRLWRSDLRTKWLSETMIALVVQYVCLFDDWLACRRSFRRIPTVPGSTGQAQINPAAGEQHRIFRDMQELARELWITPRAQLDAGLGMLRGQKALVRINKALEKDAQADDYAIPEGYYEDTTIDPDVEDADEGDAYDPDDDEYGEVIE